MRTVKNDSYIHIMFSIHSEMCQYTYHMICNDIVPPYILCRERSAAAHRFACLGVWWFLFVYLFVCSNMQFTSFNIEDENVNID